jgi:preprotein translocase subunit SecG
MIEILILLVHVAVAVGVCLLVLLQHGKGADVGAAFGSGSSGSLFGATGSANFLSRTTAVLAAMFFVTSLGLTWISGHKTPSTSVMDTHKVEQPVAPATPAGTTGVPQPGAEPGSSKAQDIPK